MMRIEKVRPNLIKTIKDHIDAISVAAKQAVKPDRITIEYPRERRKYPDNFRGFIVFDKDKCISCFRCAHICPANAIVMEDYDNRYPSIDYAKCIFCHFCIDSCPTGAIKTSKVHDVAFKSLDEMCLHTTQITKIPEIVRKEEKYTVEYSVERGVWKLVKKRKLDNLEVEVPPPEVKVRKAACIDPESCLGCRLCKRVCPQDAIRLEECEVSPDLEITGTMCVLKIDVEKCTGCGLCVRQCPMQILVLEEVKE